MELVFVGLISKVFLELYLIFKIKILFNLFIILIKISLDYKIKASIIELIMHVPTIKEEANITT